MKTYDQFTQQDHSIVRRGIQGMLDKKQHELAIVEAKIAKLKAEIFLLENSPPN